MMAHQHIGRGPARRVVQLWQHGRGTRLSPLSVFACFAMALAAFAPSSFAQDDSQQVLTVDHYVPHTSTAPATKGEQVMLYMRERGQAAVTQPGTSLVGKVVVFVQGSRQGSTSVFDARTRTTAGWPTWLSLGSTRSAWT
jgi:hypothetical protein